MVEPSPKKAVLHKSSDKKLSEKKLLIYDSENLFQGKREVLICHRGETYRLLITRAEKLILNK